jgi:hypothetical protein
MSENEDRYSILKALLDTPSNLGKRELTKLQLEGLRLVNDASEDASVLARVKEIIATLFNARKLPHGGQLGSFDPFYRANDKLVLQRMLSGETRAAAITAVYGERGFDSHEKRIKRTTAQIRKLAPIIKRAEDGTEGGH